MALGWPARMCKARRLTLAAGEMQPAAARHQMAGDRKRGCGEIRAPQPLVGLRKGAVPGKPGSASKRSLRSPTTQEPQSEECVWEKCTHMSTLGLPSIQGRLLATAGE